jgi:large subunit ribosomal protein L35
MKKYKLKTHKATVKRFKISGTGKIYRAEQQSRNNAHLRSFKNRRQKNLQQDKLVITAKGDVRRIKKLLNY